MRKWKYGLLPALCISWLAFGAAQVVDPQVYLDEVKYLSSREMRGRATGSPELEEAGRYIAGKFHDFGLKPLEGGRYLQPFPVTTSAHLGKRNLFRFTDNGHNASLHCPEEFIPFNFSSSGPFSGKVVFVGYGITAPEYHYDDYAGMDVKGKVVLVLRHEPQEYSEDSVFAGRTYTLHAQFTSKASNAKMHGAAAVILINDRANHRSEPDTLEKFGTTVGPADAGIPFVELKEANVESWFANAGKNLDKIEEDIDKDLKPESFAFPDSLSVTANLDVERAVKTVHNVVAYLPGTTNEYVIIGAHYDHLGLGEQYSLAPTLVGTIHPGADDNASGTAGVIELARWFSQQPKEKRGILFMTFSGEELGLLGSNYYVNHPILPLSDAVAMINLDMIGRLRDGKVYVGGATTGDNLRAMLDHITPAYSDLYFDYSDGAEYGSSDHSSFSSKQVPALFFFSGLHADYHKPSDTWDKINAPGAARILQVVAQLATDLRETAVRPKFMRVPPPPTDPDPSSASAGYGPYFGSVPDFGEGSGGVKFADVREGSPAAKAHLQAGDVLVEFDGKRVQNLYDFTYALRARKPGDEVLVKVLRKGKPVEAHVMLTQRP
ncbi:MAG TPA: M28 family peptidase [Bryobacteraceae bacterium]|nr:M28 family peptidase [Bryobacteraceae bacterium]